MFLDDAMYHDGYQQAGAKLREVFRKLDYPLLGYMGPEEAVFSHRAPQSVSGGLQAYATPLGRCYLVSATILTVSKTSYIFKLGSSPALNIAFFSNLKIWKICFLADRLY